VDSPVTASVHRALMSRSGRYTHSRRGPARTATAKLMGAGPDQDVRVNTFDEAVALIARKDRFIARLISQLNGLKGEAKCLIDTVSSTRDAGCSERDKRRAAEAKLEEVIAAKRRADAQHKEELDALKADFMARDMALEAGTHGLRVQVDEYFGRSVGSKTALRNSNQDLGENASPQAGGGGQGGGSSSASPPPEGVRSPTAVDDEVPVTPR